MSAVEKPVKLTELRRKALSLAADQRVKYYPYDDQRGDFGVTGSWDSYNMQFRWLLNQGLIAIDLPHKNGCAVVITEAGKRALEAAGEF